MWAFFICLLFCKHVDKYYLCIRNKNKGYETEDSPTGGEGAAKKKDNRNVGGQTTTDAAKHIRP